LPETIWRVKLEILDATDSKAVAFSWHDQFLNIPAADISDEVRERLYALRLSIQNDLMDIARSIAHAHA